MSKNVICWLYTYTNDNIDGIIIIKKNDSDQEKYILYHNIDNSIDNIDSIKKLIQEKPKEQNQIYSKQNLKTLIEAKLNN
jgi:hypothetical protein